MKATFSNHILTINAGSSSLKFGLFDSDLLTLKIKGSIKGVGTKNCQLDITDGGNLILSKKTNCKNLADAINSVILWLKENDLIGVMAIGLRLVQGGPYHRDPEVINDKLIKSISKLSYLAPNHIPDEIKIIKALKVEFKNVSMVACFDTAFHKNMPFYSKYFPLPKKYIAKGLMRYGFHGLSFEYIMGQLKMLSPATDQQKIIIAHLGNGASMVAVKNNSVIDTTMGLSPIGGLVMGTRSGDLDPSVLLFLMKHEKMTPDGLDILLSKNSGLKAIAGASDIEKLLKKEKTDPRAGQALTIFCYQAKKFIGALAAAMGGLDTLVFTGGSGENSSVIRERICADMDFLGIKFSEKLNARSADIISLASGKVKIRVIKTDENWIIAQHTHHIVSTIK